MLIAGWVAACMLVGLAILAFALRHRLLTALGYELVKIAPRLSL